MKLKAVCNRCGTTGATDDELFYLPYNEKVTWSGAYLCRPCTKVAEYRLGSLFDGKRWEAAKQAVSDNVTCTDDALAKAISILEATPKKEDPPALKFDESKLPLHLIPADLLIATGRVLAFGASKYAPENWRKGFEWHRLYDGAMRHLIQFWNGEEIDPESGEPHLAHLLCMSIFLYKHWKDGLGIDDRHKLDQQALEGLDVRDVVERGRAARRDHDQKED